VTAAGCGVTVACMGDIGQERAHYEVLPVPAPEPAAERDAPVPVEREVVRQD
jgi:hypothetical protein